MHRCRSGPVFGAQQERPETFKEPVPGKKAVIAMQEVPAVQHFDNTPMAANEYTFHIEPDRFIFDFKSLTPQFPPGGQPLHLVVAHKTVALDPWLAKQLSEQLQHSIAEYERRFGAIRQSAARAKAQKEAEKIQRSTASHIEKPSYMG